LRPKKYKNIQFLLHRKHTPSPNIIPCLGNLYSEEKENSESQGVGNDGGNEGKTKDINNSRKDEKMKSKRKKETKNMMDNKFNI
jgi:hypothetical protein